MITPLGDLAAWFDTTVNMADLLGANLTSPRSKSAAEAGRIRLTPVEIKERRLFQIESIVDNKAIHRNVTAPEARETLLSQFGRRFRQAILITPVAEHHLTLRGDDQVKIAVRSRPTDATDVDPVRQNGDRTKRRLIPEGIPVPFLVRLGVMSRDGAVIAARHAKFRQINRFLEFVADVAPRLDRPDPVEIVDFGCGKSYLTFALHHYFTAILGREVRITGLDTKTDVVESCAGIAADLGLNGIEFLVGSIGEYVRSEPVDLVVALHACDTATDDALVQAVGWRARAILAAPCCQHELRAGISAPDLEPMLKHGIIRERVAALVTDALRAQALDAAGYSVQVMEFIDLEHTAKNLLIRAVLRDRPLEASNVRADYERFRDYWGAKPAADAILSAVGNRLGEE